MGIFSDNAPRYWAAGLPVIPLHPFNSATSNSPGKAPWFYKGEDWAQFCRRVPTPEEQRNWLQKRDGNMGLPCGAASGVVAFDVDTTDENLLRLIDELVPNKGPWRRVGAKGYIAAFRYSGEKTFQIRDAEKKVICELLADGRQFVLPPSIHPATQAPYKANCELLDVVSELPRLPGDFERTLRGALTDKGVKLSVSGLSRLTEMVPKSSRDTICTSHAGLFAADVMRGVITLAEAISRIRVWAETYTEKATGDNLDPDEAVRKLIRFISRDVHDKGRPLPLRWDEGLTEEQLDELGLSIGEEEKAWAYSTINADFLENFACASTEEAKHEVIKRTLKAISRSKELSPTEIGSLLKKLSSLPGLKTPLSDLRKELAKLSQGGIKGEDHAEIAKDMANDFAERLEVRYHENQFFEWWGSHWREKSRTELKQHIMNQYSGLPVCKREADYKAILDSFATLVSKPLIEEIKMKGVNFANGVLTEDFELHQHDPKWGKTHVLPYCYRPELADEAHAPKFHRFLDQSWFGDKDAEDKKKALQEAICATLFGLATKYARVFLLQGVGGTGKSVMLRIVEGLLPPELVSAATPNQWDDKFLPAQMAGKMLNIGGELHEKNKIEGQIFKQIVGGEPIMVQHKNQQPFKLEPTCAHWFASNHLPFSEDMSTGFLRRWLILGFNNEVPERERNINLPEDILAEEREAIVAWAVQAMSRLKEQNGYTIPKSHEETIERMLVSMDTVFSFIRESPQIQKSPSLGVVGTTGEPSYAATPLQTMYEAYLNFTASGGVRPVGRPRFLLQMRQHAKSMGFRVETRTSESGCPEVGFVGLTLKGVRGETRRA